MEGRADTRDRGHNKRIQGHNEKRREEREWRTTQSKNDTNEQSCTEPRRKDTREEWHTE